VTEKEVGEAETEPCGNERGVGGMKGVTRFMEAVRNGAAGGVAGAEKYGINEAAVDATGSVTGGVGIDWGKPENTASLCR
jgi:hypothetical protein